MKRVFNILMVFALAFIATSCSNNSKSEEYELKINTVINENDPLFISLRDVFKENVERRTEGKIKVDIYSGGQLGTDEDVLEQAIVGDSVGVITDPGRLSNYVYDFSVLQAPYIVEDYDEALKLFDTNTYEELLKELNKKGFSVLSFNYFQGERELFTKSPVSKPEDLHGQRIRSSGSEIVTQTLEDMGANTTVLAWSESYQALQQKVIEGVEVHLSAALGSSIYEVTDYLTMTGHQQLLTGLVVSESWMNELPEEYQRILKEESFNAGKAASEKVISESDEYYKEILSKGVKNVEVDKEAFVKSTENTYSALGLEEIKKKIDDELGRN